MPVRAVIAFLFVAALACFAAGYFTYQPEYAVYGVPFLLLAAVGFVLRPQAEWWWYKRNPIDLDPPLQGLFAERLPQWYQVKSDNAREEFRKRVFLTELAHDFKGQGFEDDAVPADIKVLLATQAARVMEPDQTYVYQPFEVVVVYKHPFPSPAYPEHWHSSEIFAEDGVLLFNLERASLGIFEPTEYFNIVLYEWHRVKRMVLQSENLSGRIDPGENWKLRLKTLTGKSPEWVLEAIGLPETEIDGAAVLAAVEMDFLYPKC